MKRVGVKEILPVIVLSLTLLSCSRPPGSLSQRAEPVASPSPAAPKKIIDVPALLGKSRDEVKGLLGPPKYEAEVWGLDYQFEFGSAHLNFKKGKFDQILAEAGGPHLRINFETAEQAGDFFGLDLRGTAPANVYDWGTIYENLTINGVKVKSVAFTKRGYETGFSRMNLEVGR